MDSTYVAEDHDLDTKNAVKTFVQQPEIQELSDKIAAEPMV